MKYVFVCMGNTCRSPMAEAIMNAEIEKRRVLGVYAQSCGLMAFDGAPANELAVEAVKKYGVSLDFHSARRINAGILDGAIVLCMEKTLAEYVKSVYPDKKVFDLCAYAGMEGGISDPYGMGQETYDACADKIRRCIVNILTKAGRDK
ncbi:MAG: low molecular weight protein arginine phosphatase [Clostridia bacterium]|nr:low molecular weight protein arginine phosphatase [Clostridia bacterium]